MANTSLTDVLPRLHLMAARNLLESIATLSLSSAARQGIPRELVSTLQRWSLGDLSDFAEKIAAQHLAFSVEVDELHHAAERQEAERQLVRDLLLAGASYPQLEAWFGLTPRQTATLRYRYDLPHAGGDCASVPFHDRAHIRQIYQENFAYWQGDNWREARAMLHTSRATGYSIAQINRLLSRQ
ncbi:DUF2857 family protein [Salmonella enterica]|nr:DUF2857 family protein [Salmonella enterica]